MKLAAIFMSLFLCVPAFAKSKEIGKLYCGMTIGEELYLDKEAPIIESESMGSFFVRSELSGKLAGLTLIASLEMDEISVRVKNRDGNHLIEVYGNKAVQVIAETAGINKVVNVSCFTKMKDE